MSDGGAYDPTEEWTDDRDESSSGLAEFGVDPDEGSRERQEFADDQRDGYLRTSETAGIEDERQGLGEFGARPKSTKGLEEFETDGDQEGDATGSKPYDPTEEYDELEEKSEISAIGDGRRSTLEAIEAKGRLETVQSFDTIEEMTDAMREISLARPDGRIYMSPPDGAIDRLEWAYSDLPEEAQSHFLNDDTLHRRINAARNQFNDWLGRKKREQEMPSPMEAGPSNYPAEKARKKSRLAQEANEDLQERIRRVKAGAKGARQRALEAIGSSVAEKNQQEAEAKMEKRRQEWRPGDIVLFRNPNLHAGAIVRVNKKSVRVQWDGPTGHRNSTYGPEGEHIRDTIDLDSDHIVNYSNDPEKSVSDIEDSNLDRDQTLPDSEIEAQRQLLGDEWVEENLPRDDRDEYGPDQDGDDDAEYFDEGTRKQIREDAKEGDMQALLRTIGADTRMRMATEFADRGLETPADLVEQYDDRGDFENVRYVGSATSEKVEKAIPLIREAIENSADTDDVQPTDQAAEEAETDSTAGNKEEKTASTEEIRFGRLDAANQWREDNTQFLHPDDNRASKTVTISGEAPETVLDDAGAAATASQPQTKKYGQAELTDEERKRLEDRDGWNWKEHGFHARAAKAVLLEEGGTPWLDYYDMDLEPSEHVSVVNRAEDMAVMAGTTGPGEMNHDTEQSEAEIASAVDQGRGEQCSHAADHAEEGDTDAAEFLLSECDWTEEEVEQLVETAEAMGEDPARLYNPTGDFEAESDDGMEFEEWAREHAPQSSSEPEQPSDEELAEIAPASEVDELRPEAYRALQKAWTGYQIARSDAREAHDEAEKYAQVINGVRAVNGQDPLDFEEIEEWSGGEVMPENLGEEFPGPTQQKTLQEAKRERFSSKDKQSNLNTYTPTDEL